MESRSGVIQSITVSDFLRHTYLEVKFEKSINFIVGDNGSGKSAILDALILGLGGTAAQTRRCNNIKEYIRKNTKSASIEIKIQNVGPNAYNNKDYGNVITIIREIHDTGSSNYKVKSESGNLISNKCEVLKSILDAYNIQIDNPISVLTQTVKELGNFSDEQMYRFFLRATNLAQSEENYNKALEACSIAEDTLIIREQEFKNHNEKYLNLKKDKDNLELKQKRLAEKRQLKSELNFSKILKLEDELKKKDKFIRMKRNIWSRKDKIVQSLNIDNSLLIKLENDLQKKINERNKLENDKVTLEDRLSTLNTNLENTLTSKSNVSKFIASEEEKAKKLQNIMSGSAAQSREEIEQQVKDACMQLKKLACLVNDAVKNEKLSRNLLQEAEKNKQLLEKEKVELVNKERRLQNNDPVAKYGECATRLSKRLRDANGLFRQPPRGPIGVYLSPKDEIWSGALEHILGNTIRSYCVDNPEDAKTLCDIIDEVYAESSEVRPAVSCCSFLDHKHAVCVPQSGQGSVCALSALDVNDVVVHNFLVDQLQLETILLVETDDQAMMFYRGKENLPAYCKKVVTCKCSEYYPAPEYYFYGGKKRKVHFLHADERAAREALRAEFAAHDAAAAEADRELTERTKEYNDVKKHLEKRRAEENELRKRKERHESELLQIEEQLRDQEFLEKQRQEKVKFEQDLGEISKDIQNTKQKLNDLKTPLDSVNNEIKNIKTNLGKVKSEYEDKHSYIENIRIKHKETEKILNDMENYLKSKRSKNEELIEKLKLEAKRMKDCPINAIPRSIGKLTALLQDIDEELYSLGDVHDIPDLNKNLAEARKKCETISTCLKNLNNHVGNTKNLVESHLRLCQVRLNCVSLHMQNRFREMLKKCGIQGKLHIDNVLRKLRFDQEERLASGGERKFALVALLVALWDCLDVPFFCMDEFDMHLDDANYEVAVKLLLEAARLRPGCLYVFITPKEPPGLRSSSDLDIHRMDSQLEQST